MRWARSILAVALALCSLGAAAVDDRPTHVAGICEELCEMQYNRDCELCGKKRTKKAQALCYAAAQERQARCIAACPGGGKCK
jgi:hypothetical protein